MKKKMLPIILLICLGTNAQTRLPGSQNQTNSSDAPQTIDFSVEKDLKSDIEQTGLVVANRLMNCCSSWGGNNISAQIEWDGVRTSKLTNDFTIPMTVNWTGSISGNRYWIQGRLIVHSDGSKEWIKVKDSGGFSAACSNNCIQ